MKITLNNRNVSNIFYEKFTSSTMHHSETISDESNSGSGRIKVFDDELGSNRVGSKWLTMSLDGVGSKFLIQGLGSSRVG
jgi:hypothetical protein